jgi:Leucine-rich repeat (LRR) protein
MKPRLRFSLRTLFILMTAAAVILGGALGPAIRHREQKRSAVKLVAAVGGRYSVIGSSMSDRYRENGLARWLGWEEFPAELWAVNLAGTKVSGTDLTQFGRCDWIRKLDLSNTGVGDADVAHLAGLQNLIELSLTNTKVTDGALAYLSSMHYLCQLEVGGTSVTYDGLEALDRQLGVQRFEDAYALQHGPFPGVEVFAPKSFGTLPTGDVCSPLMFATALTITIQDAAKFNTVEVEHLSHLRNVRSFCISGNNTARFNSFEMLTNLKELRSVEVFGVPCLDEDLKIIAGLPKLRYLAIGDWQGLSDETFLAFGENHTLKRLHLGMGKDKTLEVTRHLGGLQALEYLLLDSWQKTADGGYGPSSPEQVKTTIEAIGRLKALPNLKSLCLWGNVITDKVMLSLANFPQLTTIIYQPDEIKDATVDALKKALPKCNVSATETGSIDLNAD